MVAGGSAPTRRPSNPEVGRRAPTAAGGACPRRSADNGACGDGPLAPTRDKRNGRRLAGCSQAASIPRSNRMPSMDRCPKCREKIHPFAATCPSCGADLDALRRRVAGRQHWRQIKVPRLTNNVTDLVVVTVILLLLALFAPLFGALLALFIIWQARNTDWSLDATSRSFALRSPYSTSRLRMPCSLTWSKRRSRRCPRPATGERMP